MKTFIIEKKYDLKNSFELPESKVKDVTYSESSDYKTYSIELDDGHVIEVSLSNYDNDMDDWESVNFIAGNVLDDLKTYLSRNQIKQIIIRKEYGFDFDKDDENREFVKYTKLEVVFILINGKSKFKRTWDLISEDSNEKGWVLPLIRLVDAGGNVISQNEYDPMYYQINRKHTYDFSV